MGYYTVQGGHKLEGEISIKGAKNAIIPVLAATLLNRNISVINNVPKLIDTNIAIKILERLGCSIHTYSDSIEVDSSTCSSFEIPEELVRMMRSSIIFAGAVLGRFGKAIISYPGGCELGARPIDLHLKGFKSMGANINEQHGFIYLEAKRLMGAEIFLDFPSVGVTENLMMAAVRAYGKTVINNTAREPEIVDLQNFLNSMGAKIKGAGTECITIEGVDELHDTEYSIMPDRIVAGTYLAAAAITGGRIILNNVIINHLSLIAKLLADMGCIIKTEDRKIILEAPTKLKAIELLRTAPYPGFPTDMQPQFMALLSVAEGTSIVRETVFESRNKHVSELCRMGADIILAQDGMTCVIRGVNSLNGNEVVSKNLRGGAALILAGLKAEGITGILDSCHVERGYEHIEKDLCDLGADIKFAKGKGDI